MKKLFLTSVFLFLVFTFGCQESFITNPPVPDATQVQGNDWNLADIGVDWNIIDFCCPLHDPVRGRQCELTGQVSYNNRFINSIDDGYLHVKVSLIMSSHLCNKGGNNHPLWKIEGKSKDVLLFDRFADEIKLLKKTYKICNRCDIELCVTYEISPKVVEIKCMKLGPCPEIIDIN